MTEDLEIDKAFQQLKNIRLQIYKNLADIDHLCQKSDTLTHDILQEYVTEKERISANEMDETDSFSPFKNKSGGGYNSKEGFRVNCFPGRKVEVPQQNTKLSKQQRGGGGGNGTNESSSLPQEIYLPDLFNR